MLVKSFTRRGEPDPISEVLGDTRYATPYYPPGLSDPRMKFPIGVTRHYMLMDPQVIVDFEPSPLDDPPQMHCEAKRKWCHEHGIVYVPIFLREKLTQEQFEERVKVERRALAESVVQGKAYEEAPAVDDDEFNRQVDKETIDRFTVVLRHYKMPPAAKTSYLKRLRKEVEVEFLRKRQDGQLGRYVSYRQPALASR